MSEVASLGNGRYLVRRADGSTTMAAAVVTDRETWVFVDGDIFVVPVADDSSFADRRVDDPSALAPPMPATVVAINVSTGDTVAAGEVVVLLEAMKMELPIKAPRAGVIAAIHCRVGELVEPGVPLIDLS